VFYLLDVAAVGIYGSLVLLITKGLITAPHRRRRLRWRGYPGTTGSNHGSEADHPASGPKEAYRVRSHHPNISFTLSKNPLESGFTSSPLLRANSSSSSRCRLLSFRGVSTST